MMANDNNSRAPLDDEKHASTSISTSGEVVEFGEELNKNLSNAIFKLDPTALVRDDKVTPLIDLYQIAESWAKLKFKKSEKTWVVERDAFASKAGEALAKSIDDDEKLAEVVAEKATKLTQDDSSGDRVKAEVELEWWVSGASEMPENAAEELCKKIWDGLARTKWSPSVEDKITDQNISREIYHSFVNPFKQDGTQCQDGEFVTIAKPLRSCWYTDGNYVPGSSVQIWHRAIDPIAWFGKLASEKPKTLTSYDSQEVALDPPTKELEEATLAEDEAFGYAK